jgi:hypothetical protein
MVTDKEIGVATSSPGQGGLHNRVMSPTGKVRSPSVRSQTSWLR